MGRPPHWWCIVTLTMRDHLVPADKRIVSKGRNTRRYLTIHETANTGAGADAAAHARLQANGNSRKASWHWTVDDHEAVRSYEHGAICVHAGNRQGSATSIAIEICVNSDGNRAKAIANAAELAAIICRDEQIPLANIVQHNHWSSKDCPTGIRDGVPMGWASFLALVRTELAALTGTTPIPPEPPKDDDMTPAELTAAIKAAIAPLAADLAEVKRQVAESQDATAKKGRTLRHICASDLNNGG